MSDFLEGVQWILSAGGAIGAVSTYFLHTKVDRQKHKLDKLKTKFDYMVNKRNEVIVRLNSRIADIKIWMIDTQNLDDADFIDMQQFRELVRQFEVTLIHGQYLLSSPLRDSVTTLLDAFNKCIRIFNEEEEKLAYGPVAAPPKDTFAMELFKSNIQELLQTVTWRLGKEIAGDEE
ncbi:hypothetical protein [Alistipes sp. i18-0019-D1]|uniref:hypothetical protein n=1 Tax=Alistipes sp. i18-0019-D1 TaxID=3132707 RepID=UPI0036F3BDEB